MNMKKSDNKKLVACWKKKKGKTNVLHYLLNHIHKYIIWKLYWTLTSTKNQAIYQLQNLIPINN